MNERIRVGFSRGGDALPVTRLSAAGLVFAFEESAAPLGFGIGLEPANPIVAQRMAQVRQREDWQPNEFRLKVSREEGSLVISGAGKRDAASSLPGGQYRLRFPVSETRLENEFTSIDIPESGEAVVELREPAPANRLSLVDPSGWDAATLAVCRNADSRIDGMDPLGWLAQPQPRLARKACLLNLLAKARSLPSARPAECVSALIESIRWADVDRIAVRARPGLPPAVRAAQGWRDTGPIDPVHAKNLAQIFGGRPADYKVESSREPVLLRSMQIVCATHKQSGSVVAELDVDLGNPKQDAAGLFVHVGELIDPGRTDHLALFGEFAAGSASDFLYYRLEQAAARPAGP